MADRRQYGAAFRLLALFTFTLLTLIPVPAIPGGGEPVDHPCIPDPVFPSDCVDQLGAIGDPPSSPTGEGYRGIVSPVVDPLLRLETEDTRNGRLYAVNPAGSTVRVYAPDATQVLADVQVCYRPSALAQDTTGDRVFVSCHASNAVGIIDTQTHLMVGVVQDRDELGRPKLQEPMALVFVEGTLYVASSQNNRVAVIDPVGETVLRYIEIPGQDPRSLTVTDDGAYLIVANLLAGNRTEPGLPVGSQQTQECLDLLQSPGAMAVFDESSPDFMDTSHPLYAEIAECYFAWVLGGEFETIVHNPVRHDHDLVVVRLSDEQVVFTTNSLTNVDPGTLNYGVRVSGSKVYLANVHARNVLGSGFGNRPLINQLTVLDLDTSTGQLTLAPASIRDLDDPFLDENGNGASRAATPYAVAVEAGRVLVAAAGSDRLVVADLNGNITGTVPVGFGPKGVVAQGDTAWVYNATGLSISVVDLSASTSVETAGLGPSPVPETVRLGARLFDSAKFAANKTFACASCHPDSHLDGLVWLLAEPDGLRATMSSQQISETAPYHWDGSKCNLVDILQDGIFNLFGSPVPTDCEMKVMIDHMNGLVHPRTPFRPLDDGVTDQAALGSAVLHRFKFLDGELKAQKCNNRAQDMSVEGTILEATGDPDNSLFQFREGCGASQCHAAPHMGTGLEPEGDAIAPTFLLGLWDRQVAIHDSSPQRAKILEAVQINRVFHGSEAVGDGDHFTGEVTIKSLMSIRFNHKEFNFDNDPTTHGFTVSDASAQFMLEEHEFQSGAVGLPFVLREDTAGDLHLLDFLESAANQGKTLLLGIGTLGGQMLGLTWEPSTSTYHTDEGGELTRQDLLNALTPGDAMLLSGKLLPDPDLAPNPKIQTLRRDTAPYLCAEDYADYPAAVEVGQTNAVIRILGIDVVSGSRVLINGQVTGAPLSGPGPAFGWTLPVAPPSPTILSVQVLGPNGMLSNTLPLPVVDPVVPPGRVEDVVARREGSAILLSWESQFGVTGPGTQYDVHRGRLSDLRSTGFGIGDCLLNEPDATIPELLDSDLPASGDGYYYVIRAQNQLGTSTWGTPQRDAEVDSCATNFP